MKGFFPLSALALSIAPGGANAASVTYLGVDYNVDAVAKKDGSENQPGGWRTPTNAKFFDIDGDNVYGTDGYYLRGGDTTESIPYIGSITRLAREGNNFGAMDDPSDPTGFDDFQVGFWGKIDSDSSFDLFEFTVGGRALEGKTLRVGVLFDTFNSAVGEWRYTWTQTKGGRATASSDLVTASYDGYDFVFFDFTNVKAGDSFTLSVSDAVSWDTWHTFGGVVFDSEVNSEVDDTIPEPSAFSLIAGMFGMAWVMLRRRS